MHSYFEQCASGCITHSHTFKKSFCPLSLDLIGEFRTQDCSMLVFAPRINDFYRRNAYFDLEYIGHSMSHGTVPATPSTLYCSRLKFTVSRMDMVILQSCMYNMKLTSETHTASAAPPCRVNLKPQGGLLSCTCTCS